MSLNAAATTVGEGNCLETAGFSWVYFGVTQKEQWGEKIENEGESTNNEIIWPPCLYNPVVAIK